MQWRIDWKRFIVYFGRHHEETTLYYYEGVPSKGFYFDNHPGCSLRDFNDAKKAKKRFFQYLRGLGFTVRSKPIGRVYDSTEGRFKHKCNFDVELTIDALDKLNDFDALVLCSGDGDFEKLIKFLKGKLKKTIVVAPSERLSRGLEKAANQVLYLEDIRADIERVQSKKMSSA